MTEEIVFEGLCGNGCTQWKIEGDHACHRCDIMDEDDPMDEDNLQWDDPY